MQTFSAHIILGNVIWIVFKHVDIWSWKTTLGIPSLAWQRKTFWKMLLGFYVIMINFESWNIKSCNIQIAWVNFFSWLVKPFLAKSNLESSVKNLQISKFSLISQCVWFLEVDRKNISDRIYLSKVTGPSSSLNDNSSVGLLACKSHFTRSTFRKWQSQIHRQNDGRLSTTIQQVNTSSKPVLKHEINILVLLKITTKDTKWICWLC